MVGATVYSIYKNYEELSFDDAGLIAIGFLVAWWMPSPIPMLTEAFTP